MSLGTFGGGQYAGCRGAFNSPACGWLCAEVIGVPCDNNPHLNPPPAHHCVDGSDNDLDGKTDFSDEECTATPGWGDDEHPGLPIRKWESGESFALFGEGRFRTQYENSVGGKNWIQRPTRADSDPSNPPTSSSRILKSDASPFRERYCSRHPGPVASAASRQKISKTARSTRSRISATRLSRKPRAFT